LHAKFAYYRAQGGYKKETPLWLYVYVLLENEPVLFLVVSAFQRVATTSKA
jgi:hypothetical protein